MPDILAVLRSQGYGARTGRKLVEGGSLAVFRLGDRWTARESALLESLERLEAGSSYATKSE